METRRQVSPSPERGARRRGTTRRPWFAVSCAFCLCCSALVGCPKKGQVPDPGKPTGPTGALGATGPKQPVGPTAPLQPTTPSVATTPEQAALEAFARGLQAVDTEPKLALEAFREAVKLNPKLHVALFNIGVVLERLGDDAAAEKHYRGCLDLAGDYAPAVMNLANLLLRQEQNTAALALTSQTASKYPTRLDLRSYYVKALVAARQYRKAIEVAKAILREDEKNVGAMMALSSIYYSEKKFELAAHAMRLALKIDPENPDVHHRLGHALLALGEKKAAKDAFLASVKLKPDFPEALNSVSMLLLEEGDAGRAMGYLEEAVRLSPSFVAAHQNLGNAYRKSGDVVRAKAEYLRVLQLRPKESDAVFNLALLYLDHAMPDAPTPIKRLEVALEHFGRYRDLRGRLPPSDPANRYIAESSRKLVQLRRAEEKKRERERLKAVKKDLEGKKLNLGGK